MNIDILYPGMPVCHIETNKQMLVKQVMPAGNIKCNWTDQNGEDQEQLFWPNELEDSPLQIGDILIFTL